jgi:hypothetical protein
MRKISTLQKKTDLISDKEQLENHRELQPKAVSLQRILQFASSYRVEQIIENQYVEWYLN